MMNMGRRSAGTTLFLVACNAAGKVTFQHDGNSMYYVAHGAGFAYICIATIQLFCRFRFRFRFRCWIDAQRKYCAYEGMESAHASTCFASWEKPVVRLVES